MGEPVVRGLGKFIVLKNEDLDKYLTAQEEYDLYGIVSSVDAGRMVDGKVYDNRYLVINRDEPYAVEVIEIMKKHGHWDEES